MRALARIDDRSLLRNPWFLAGGAALLWVIYARMSSRKSALAPDIGQASEGAGGRVIDPLNTVILDSLGREAFLRALPDAGKQYAGILTQVAAEKGIPPFILAAIMERESGYGLAPACHGAGPTCSNGVDFGLMQINKAAHPDFFEKRLANGGPYWSNPLESVRYGADVLLGTFRYFRGAGGKTVSVSAKNAARLGVLPGSYADPRPLAGLDLWQAALAGYNNGAGNVVQALAAGRSADAVTAGKDYGADVLKRATRIAKETARQLSGVS